MVLTTRWFCALLLAPCCFAQVNSRAEEIEQARRVKSQQLEPEKLTGAEKTLQEIKHNDLIERITGQISGWGIRFGGLVSGSGFALGPDYTRRGLLNGNVDFKALAVASWRKYEKAEIGISMPRLANDRLFLNLGTVYRNYPSINYYGPGPGSKKTGRSDFRLEDTSLNANAGVRPIEHLRLGVDGGYMLINVGPGRDDRFARTQDIYSPATTPGLDRQANYLQGGPFIQFDYRDRPGGPRRGGNYIAKYSYYWDRKFGNYSFRTLDLEAQQYIPCFNERRVIALRAKSVLTDTNPGQVVPFYMQPVAGGSETLRGFRPFRFYDNNLIVANAEYRWEVFSGLDMALFYDTGKVFPRWHDWNFRHLEEDYGFGFRFNVRDNVFMRVDFGFSREGFQAWVKVNNVF